MVPYLSPPAGRTGSAKNTKKRLRRNLAKPFGSASLKRSLRSCKMRCLLAVRQVPGGFRQKKSNAKNGNKRKNGRLYGVQNNHDGIVLRACRSGAGTLCITSGIHCSFHGTHHDPSLPFFEMVQAYHLRRDFSSRIILPVKTLYHTTKNTPAARGKIVESARVFFRFFTDFPHFPIHFFQFFGHFRPTCPILCQPVRFVRTRFSKSTLY